MAGKRKSRFRKKAYSVAQWTWGLPQTLLGAALYLRHRKGDHFDFKGARVTLWDRREGISLGKFVFLPEEKDGRADDFLLTHEYGHTIQSLILGPAYLLLVGLPSFVWNRSRFLGRRRKAKGRSYYSAVFERTANELGAKVLKRKDRR